MRAAGHLSAAVEDPGPETPEEFELTAWLRAMPPEVKRALLELRPVMEAMAEKLAEAERRNARAEDPAGRE